jgi:hypothetical protein
MFKPGIGISTQGKASGTLKLKGPLPENENFQNLVVQTSFDIASLSLPMEHNKKMFPLEIPSLKGTVNLNQNKLIHKVNAKLLGGKVDVVGNLNIENKKSANTTIKLKTIDLSSLDQFNPSMFGSISGDAKLKGHLSDNGKSLTI